MKLLVAISDAGNLRVGAAGCFMSTSSASIRLKNLEDVMGTPLFHRHARGLTPTDAGLAMVGHARNCLQVLDLMHTEVGNIGKNELLPIRFFANCTSIATTLIDDIQPFLFSNSKLRIQLEEHQSSDIVAAVKSGKTDLGLVISEHTDSELVNLDYRMERLVFIVPSAMGADFSSHTSFRDACRFPMISTGMKSTMHNFLAGKALQLKTRMDVRIHVDGFLAAARLVQQGAGCAVVPERLIKGSLRRGLKTVRLLDEWALRQLVVCYSREWLRERTRIIDLAEHLVAMVQSSDIHAGELETDLGDDLPNM
ncbi:MAG: LysR family transcriptional regulator [Rhodoferax sp.]|nr:LysR family transcriptional regulator [Rhodoferax sp.]